MMKGGHGQTNQLHDINWSAPQPCISCTPINVKKKNTMCVSMCVHEIVCTYSTDIVHARNRIVDFALCNLPFQTFL